MWILQRLLGTEHQSFCMASRPIRIGSPPPQASVSPHRTYSGKATLICEQSEGVVGPNSDDWTENLALCTLCDVNHQQNISSNETWYQTKNISSISYYFKGWLVYELQTCLRLLSTQSTPIPLTHKFRNIPQLMHVTLRAMGKYVHCEYSRFVMFVHICSPIAHSNNPHKQRSATTLTNTSTPEHSDGQFFNPCFPTPTCIDSFEICTECTPIKKHIQYINHLFYVKMLTF